MLRNPVEFLQPNVRMMLGQDQENSRILRQRIGQSYITFTFGLLRIRTWNPKWKNRSHSIGLRLEGVSVEGRGLIKHVQIVGPLHIVQPEPGTKADCAPFS